MSFRYVKVVVTVLFSASLFFTGCAGVNDNAEGKNEVKAKNPDAVVQQENAPAAEGTPPASGQDVVFEPHLKGAQKVVHPPYEWGDCTTCHQNAKPVDGDDLVSEQPDLCYTCHQPKDDKDFIHGPVAAGACTACHNPHESENSRLLVSSNMNDLCTSCHMAKADFLKNTANIHPPVADQCTNCHDPHTDRNKFQLKGEGKMEMCVMCHTDKGDQVHNSKTKHGAMGDANKCQACHDPHGTNNPKMLRYETNKDLCLSCHNKEMTTEEDGTKIMNMAQHLEQNPDWHGPILWGDCVACHNPHGSDNLRMLKKPFPETFYSKFDKDSYICFECHEPEKMTEVTTTTATNFRNGEKNMHSLHVNNAKGRTCRACHDFHGTKEYPHHLKKKTKFGRIDFPIRYIETPTGGSCAPACHARRHYDRVTPKVNLK